MESPSNLQEAITHEGRAERHREIDDPHRQLEVGRDLPGAIHARDEHSAENGDVSRLKRAREQDQDHPEAPLWPLEQLHQNVDAAANQGAFAVGFAELYDPLADIVSCFVTT